MNVSFSKQSLGILFFALSFCALAQQHSYPKGHDTPTQNLHKGIEPFKAKHGYVLTMMSLESTPSKHLKNRPFVVFSNNELDELYLKLAADLPAGTLFRIRKAHEDKNGNIEVKIRTKEPLIKSEILAIHGVVGFKNELEGVFFNVPGQVKPDPATKHLPADTDKEESFQAIFERFNLGERLVKVSVVFDNADNNRKYWQKKPFYEVISHLKKTASGREYGLGYSEGIAWWTQDLSLDQVNYLSQHELVINVILR